MKKSISRNITFALLGYTLFTVLLLWMFQIIFLNKYYQMMQKADIIRAGSQLAQQIDDPDFEDILEQACFSHRMSALVYDAQKNVALSVDMLGRSSMFNQRDKRPDSSRPDNSWPMPTNPVLEGRRTNTSKLPPTSIFAISRLYTPSQSRQEPASGA